MNPIINIILFVLIGVICYAMGYLVAEIKYLKELKQQLEDFYNLWDAYYESLPDHTHKMSFLLFVNDCLDTLWKA